MGKPYIIGIAGGSGAGKTLFLKRIQAYFNAENISVISQDNYYRPAHEQVRDENGEINFDRPEGIDHEAFLKDIEALSGNKLVQRREYMFNQPGVTGKNIIIKPAPLIIVEGLFIFHFPEIRNLLDLKIFIDAHHETRWERRLKRDHHERGLSHETIHYQWNNHVVPAFDMYLLPYKADTDMVIENNGTIADAVEKLLIMIREKYDNIL